MQAPLKQS